MLNELNRVLWSPGTFFTKLPPWPVSRVVALAVSISSVSGIVRAKALTFVSASAAEPRAADALMPGFTTLVVILLPALCFYVLVGRRREAALTRVVSALAWAQAPMMFAVVPTVGPTVAELWCVWLSAASVHYAFESSWAASFAALGLSWLLLTLSFVALYHLM